MTPLASPCHSRPVHRLPDGRAALELRGAVGDLLRREREVVRAGLDAEADPFCSGPGEERQRVRVGEVQDVGPGASLTAASTTWAMARSSASLGREARNAAYRGPSADGGTRRSSRGPRRGRSRAVEPSHLREGGLEARSPRGGNSSTPECSRKHLKRRRLRRAGAAGRRGSRGWPAPEPDVHERLPVGCLLLGPQGLERRGRRDAVERMSTIVVTPPAAAARVALAKPSHSVRPGSLTCTWVSTRPGRRTTSPPRRMVSSPESAARAAPSAPSGSTATIRPPLMPTAAAPSPRP